MISSAIAFSGFPFLLHFSCSFPPLRLVLSAPYFVRARFALARRVGSIDHSSIFLLSTFRTSDVTEQLSKIASAPSPLAFALSAITYCRTWEPPFIVGFLVFGKRFERNKPRLVVSSHEDVVVYFSRTVTRFSSRCRRKRREEIKIKAQLI